MNPNNDITIEVTSRHEPVSDRMRNYAMEKAQRLLRFHSRISRIQIVVDDAHNTPDVEMIVHVDSGATLVARERQEHLKSAIDLLCDKMERQLVKNNRKRKHHKGIEGAKGSDGEPDQPADDTPGEETYDDAVRRDLG